MAVETPIMRKASLPFVACMALLAVCNPASAHPREAIGHGTSARHKAMAIADTAPRARIRGDARQAGLGPRAFARWISRHPAFATAMPPESLRILARSGPNLPSASAFSTADVDNNGLVSAEELADFLARPIDTARERQGPI